MIGNLQNWKNSKLSELGEIITGNTPSKKHEEYYGGTIPWVKPSDLDKFKPIIETDKYLTKEGAKLARILPKDAILVSCIGNLAKVGIAGISLATNQQINAIIFNEKIYPKFGYYVCRRLRKAIESYATATTLPIITKSKFSEIQISYPSLTIQQKIASILEKCESSIEKRKEANRLTDEFLKSTFLKMFKETYLIKNMTEIFYIKTGKLNANAAKENGLYPFFTCSRKTFAINDFAFDQEALILSGNNATAEYSVKHYKGKFNAYQRTYILTLKDSNNSYEFFKISLENQLNILKNRSIGSNTKYLTMDIMERIQLVVPPIELQHKFADIVQKTEKLKEKQKESEKELNNLFNSLMQKSFKGELFQ